MIGSSILLIIFFILFYYGVKIAITSTNMFNKFLALGITVSIFIQFFINIGVVIGLLPVTGVTLPFMSYGGSSLILNYFMIGILVSINDDKDEELC